VGEGRQGGGSEGGVKQCGAATIKIKRRFLPAADGGRRRRIRQLPVETLL
jgi:hypothetical protein